MELADKVRAIGSGGIGLVHPLARIELRRNDEVFLDALSTERIPNPTTAGDFCRRFQEADQAIDLCRRALATPRNPA